MMPDSSRRRSLPVPESCGLPELESHRQSLWIKGSKVLFSWLCISLLRLLKILSHATTHLLYSAECEYTFLTLISRPKLSCELNEKRDCDESQSLFSPLSSPFVKDCKQSAGYSTSTSFILNLTLPWRSISSTLTLTTSPSLSLSLTLSTRSSEICEI